MSSTSTPKLQLGKRIDCDTLEFVEVLGVGGYGVVYRAVDVSSSERTSYAVKCLLHAKDLRPARKQFHIREIALHQISSAHPGIVTLHRIIEDHDYTYIIMDYAPDHDLFTQILHHCRYLGNDALIKHVFLQLVDAVEYCHSLGIYHRDLKPENILCFDDGCSVAITDFGLATTQKVSDELHTGSIYHMSPECQGGAFALDGRYSPKSNDIWSLGIILLNLATGRNPWQTATIDDLTFQAYLKDPLNFFPSVLPISHEINDILLQMLHVDWQQRVTLPELRQQMEDISSFYAPDVVFDGSQARCSWEATDASKIPPVVEKVPPHSQGLTSYWSDDASITDFGGHMHEVPACNLSSPQVSGFPPEKKPRNVPAEPTMLDRRSSSSSSSSSRLSYSTSPSTPDGNDKPFANSGLVEITMEDVFEMEMPREEHELEETGMVPSMSSSLFLKVPRPSLDAHVPKADNPWATADSGEAVPSWAILPELKLPARTPKNPAFSPSHKPTSPIPIEGGRPRISTAAEVDPSCSGDKASSSHMKFFSRPTGVASSVVQDSTHVSHDQTAPVSIPLKPGVNLRKDAEVTDGRWKIGKFGRNWFSPTKLFISTAAS
ncbi:hypothetical protein DXG01_001666 [Tephrocybe rancida]|nr:hypothetical protein DXG01_001666 [Tephrocybe rancida]